MPALVPRRPVLALVVAGALAAPLLPAARDEAAAASTRSSVQVSTPVALGYDRIGVRRGDTWLLRDALDGGPSRDYREGAAGWRPVAGDLDGDGAASLSLYRDGVWLLRDREQGPARTVRYGLPGDLPVIGDWNGDGVDTIGLFRRGRWYLRASNASAGVPSHSFAYGQGGDVPVVGDWNGNGTDDIGVRRAARWFQRDAAGAGPSSRSFDYGLPGDVPVAGDWDHDGKDQPGLFRAGTWYFRRGSFASPSQTTRFGAPGDLPVVRKVPGLAPGVRHRVVRDPAAPWVAHVAEVDLAAPSSPETVLSQDRLVATEVLSSMTRRAGAVVGVNGDFFLGSGRPVHLYANDGRLGQSPTILGRAFGLDASGTRFRMGYPDLRVTATARPPGGAPVAVPVGRTNQGIGPQSTLSAFTSAGAQLESPPDGQCYAALLAAGARVVRPDGTVDTPLRAGAPRCGGARPLVPTVGTLVSAVPGSPAAAFVRGLAAGTPVTLTTQLGFPGAVDVLGGNPLLVVDGAVIASEVDGTAPFFARTSRTAVGVTADGRLLLVVVDGKQPGYSRGMTLRELAELMVSLGARQALNLDGGGSSEMVVNGLVASRPSDGRERGLANALVVLPGPDTGHDDLVPGPAVAPVAALTASLRGPSASDPGSTGGLADALVRQGVPVSGELRRTASLFRGGG